MKVYYYSISVIPGGEERRFIFIPNIGIIATNSTEGKFCDADNLRARFDTNPKHLEETKMDIKFLKDGGKIVDKSKYKIKNYKYLGGVNIHESIINPLLEMKEQYDNLGKMADKEIKDLEKIVKENLNRV